MPNAKTQYFQNGRPIKLVQLARRSTADGLLEIANNVRLGNTYIVYTEPVEMRGLHKPTGQEWSRLMYECTDGGWLPVEMLEDAAYE